MQYNKNVSKLVNAILDLTWAQADTGVWLFVASSTELDRIDDLLDESPTLPDQAIAWQEDRIVGLEANFEVAKATFEVRIRHLSPLAAEAREEAQNWQQQVAAAGGLHDRLSEELELLKAFATTLK